MSRLTDIIGLLYRMTDADRRDLETRLLDQRKRAWTTALREEAARHNCNKQPRAPSGVDLQHLKQLSTRDAKSIVKTWNADVRRAIERLYAENPRGNRAYYAKRMEAWAAERAAWKDPQIAITTETTAAEYARERFRELNYSNRQYYRFSGPKPTCQDCARRFAAGTVDEAYTRRYPCPRHIGCPHSWRPANPPKLKCSQIWLG